MDYPDFSKYAFAQKDAALWRLRWCHAITMVQLFDTLRLLEKEYYFTATGDGPSCYKASVEVAPGKHVEYKHTPKEWAKIWTGIVEKLLLKVKECNERLKKMENVAPKRNCPNCAYCQELQDNNKDTYKTFCTSCGHWLDWEKRFNCKSFIPKEESA